MTQAVRCPVDHAELDAGSFGGYRIDRCPQCLAAAVNGNLLRDVRAFLALELHKRQGCASALLCPNDGTAMKTLGYKGVVMDACPRCLGLWLAAGQWSRLLELAGPPRQTDLSTIGRSLARIPNASSFNNLESFADILELSADLVEAIGKISD